VGETVALSSNAQEMIADAIENGLGSTPEDVVDKALENFLSAHLLRRHTPGELRRIGEEAIADTRPGLPPEQVLAEMESFCDALEAERRNVNAA
jgi:hypothetical protein